MISSSGAGSGNVDALFVVGAVGPGGEIVGGRAVGSEWLGVVLGATSETYIHRRPAVCAGRSTRSTACLDRLIGLADERLAVVTTSDRHRLLLHARI